MDVILKVYIKIFYCRQRGWMPLIDYLPLYMLWLRLTTTPYDDSSCMFYMDPSR
jgi:hypothetical protein